jgi:DNA-binding GntR family transcriptional regulator
MKHKSTSLADQVFERLETDIIAGKYKRGQILTELMLTEDLGVSRTPIREAIQMLEQEQLVKAQSKGILVLGVTEKDLCDIYSIRVRIEGLAAAGAAKNQDEEGLKNLTEALSLQQYYVEKYDPERVQSMDNKFHETVYEMCGSAVLCATLLPLHRKVQKYRKISFQSSSRGGHSYREHKEIYDAIVAGDAELAEKLMTSHVKNALDRLMRKTY